MWTDAGSFSGCSRIEIDGLTPGQFYGFRLRAFDRNGQGTSSELANLRML